MIELLIINSLFIFGVYASFQPNMIFERFGDVLDLWKYSTPFKEFIRKPLGACPVCMASVYGFPVYWLYYLVEPFNLGFAIIVYICYSFALAGLNMIILSFMNND